MPRRAPDTITITVSAAALRDAALDLRIATLRSLALCRDILDRLADRREPARELRHD